VTPLNLGTILGQNSIVFLLIGFFFGFVLEKSGFGDSKKLAAQFYFYEMRVLKVMFTAIVTAMILIFLSSSLGILDFNKVFVNPTYLWPGIVGGFVMGFGFILGGFCPGTSIVGAATLKIDAIFFVIGVFFGVYVFGETEPYFDYFYNSSSYGRLLLSDLLGVDAGWIVASVFVMAIGAFALAQWGESLFSSLVYQNQGASTSSRHPWVKASQWGGLAAVILILILGQPDLQKRWTWLSSVEGSKLDNKFYHIHPYELRDLMVNKEIYLNILDIRSVEKFNLFHLEGAKNILPDTLAKKNIVNPWVQAPSNTVFVLIDEGSNDRSSQAWKNLKALDLMNLYILDGGVENWLAHFPLDKTVAQAASERGGIIFSKAVGDSQFSSYPIELLENEHTHSKKIHYEKKVKLQSKSTVKGGCG